jgi:hypothetical protein
MNMLPAWNKRGSFSAGRDPLGLQAASVRLYTELLPGLTNVTNRLRYFTFYCWVVRQFEILHHTTNPDRWSIFIRRAEAAYVLSCVRADRVLAQGMAGSIWANSQSGFNGSLDFKPWTDDPGKDGQYLKANWGNFGQFYVASMQEMKMLEETDERVQAVTEDYGLELANAFEAACPDACQHLLAAIETGTIGPAEADEIAGEAHPAYLDHRTQESHVLVEYLCGSRGADPTAHARQATLWNVLNLVDRAGVSEEWELRRELYVQDHVGAVANDRMVANLNGWRAYFVNELCHIALEVLLNSLTYRINAAGSANVGLLTESVVRRAIGKAAETSGTLAELAERWRLKSLDQEHRAGDRLAEVASSNIDPEAEDLATAIKLILSIWRRWGNDENIEAQLKPATVEDRSALGVFRFLDRNSGAPALEALVGLVRKFVVSNHMVIAGQKLAGAGTYTYRFIVDEGSLVDGVPAEYGFTTPRIGNLLTFADDGGLIEDAALTNAGKAFLSAD